MLRKFVIISALLTISASIYSQSNKTGIALIKKIVVGGEGGWDYVTVSAEDRRIYLSHGNQVEVINADTHEKIGMIPDTKGVHGIATIPALGKGYITNGKADNVTVFNSKTLQPITILPAGTNPDALMYDNYSGRVFIFNNDSKNITVIDSKTDKIIQTIDIGGNPEAGVSNGKGLIYVNLEDANEIVGFDAKTLQVVSRFKLSPGEQPTGLAFDTKTNRLFSACRKSQLMMVLDASSGKILAQLPIGRGVDGAVFDNKTKLAICSNGDGTMTVVKELSPEKYVVFDTIKTVQGARTMAIDKKTGHLFTVTAQYGETPAPTAANPRPRPSILPNTFMLLEYGKK
jgi:YVTN family beta-propeller protein